MNTRLVTTGLIPLTIGSMETFQLAPTLNGLPWNLLLGSVVLRFLDPNGTITSYPATIQSDGYGASLIWVVPNVPGSWARAWLVTDGAGLVQASQPIVFLVQASP